jgi:glucuronoarabinoxylan endo-1,4-beta-xylanase
VRRALLALAVLALGLPRLAAGAIGLDTGGVKSGTITAATGGLTISSLTYGSGDVYVVVVNWMATAALGTAGNYLPFTVTLGGSAMSLVSNTNKSGDTGSGQYPHGISIYTASGSLSSASLVVTPNITNAASALVAFYPLTGASSTITNGVGVGYTSPTTGPLSSTITASGSGSWIIGGVAEDNANVTWSSYLIGTTSLDVPYNDSTDGISAATWHLVTTGAGSVTGGFSYTNDTDIDTAAVEVVPASSGATANLTGVTSTGAVGTVTSSGAGGIGRRALPPHRAVYVSSPAGASTFTNGTASLASLSSSGAVGSVSSSGGGGSGTASLAGVSAAGAIGAVSASGVGSALTADLGALYQVMDGFGASDRWLNPIGSSVLDLLFNQKTGIGLSLFRMSPATVNAWATGTVYPYQDWASNGTHIYECETPGGGTSGATAPTGTGTGISDGTLTWDYIGEKGATAASGLGHYQWNNVLGAISRNASLRVIATPWSPDPLYKTVSTVVGGAINPTYYTQWAAELASFASAFNTQTSTYLYGIGIQNEPDLDTAYDSCTFSATQTRDFIKALFPALSSLGLGTTPIIVAPEVYDQSTLGPYVSAIEADGTALADTGIYAFHQYASPSTLAPTSNQRHYWQTEQSSFDNFDPSIANGLTVAGWIHNAITTAGVSAWFYWWLDGGTNTDNEGLVGYSTDADPWNNPTIPKRLYTVGNFSRFIRPGFQRVGISGSVPSGVSLTAYKDSGGNPVLVAINTNGTTTSLSVVLHGGSTPAWMTPYVTDSSNNLAAQAPTAISSGTLSYTLNANSVTTFTSSASVAGVTATGAVGSLSAVTSASVTLSSLSATGAPGALKGGGGAALASAAGTGAVGAPSSSGTGIASVASLAGTGAAQALTSSGTAVRTLAGIAGTGAAGALGSGGGAGLALLTSAGAIGAVSSSGGSGSASSTLTSTAGTGALGALTAGASATLVLNAGTGFVGPLSASGSSAGTANLASLSSTGAISAVSGGVSVSLASLGGAGAAGALKGGGGGALASLAGVGALGAVQGGGGGVLALNAGTGYLGPVSAGGSAPGTATLTGISATGAPGALQGGGGSTLAKLTSSGAVAATVAGGGATLALQAATGAIKSMTSAATAVASLATLSASAVVGAFVQGGNATANLAQLAAAGFLGPLGDYANAPTLLLSMPRPGSQVGVTRPGISTSVPRPGTQVVWP